MSDAELQSVTPFANLAAVMRHHDQLLGCIEDELGDRADVDAEVRILTKLEQELQGFLAASAATGMYLDDYADRTKVQAVIDYWSNRLARTQSAVARTRLVAFDASSLPQLPDNACPYVGTEPFRAGQHFFGREADVQEILARLEHEPVVIIRGPAGSGKSSLLHAGVLASLPSDQRLVVSLRPGSDPIGRLTVALGAQMCATLSRERLLKKPESIREILVGAPPMLLALDQFEEIFVLAPPAELHAFDRLLAVIVDAQRDNRVILCIDDGAFEHVALGWLGEQLDRSKAHHGLRPLDNTAFERAITGPAAAVNLEIKPGVVEYLVRELARDPVALPLLQFTLRRLWAAREHNRVTLATLKTFGELRDVFDSDAENRYAQVVASPRGEDTVRRLLLRLVRIDDFLDYHRQPALVEALENVDSDVLLPLLKEHGFVDIVDDEFVEIRNEAHLHHWKRLIGWIKEERRRLRGDREALASAARIWDAAQRPREGLYRRPQITVARKLGGLGQLELEFLSEGEMQLEFEFKERDRLKTRMLWLASTAAVLLLGLATFAVIAWRLENAKNKVDEDNAVLVRRNAALQWQNGEIEKRNTALEQENTKLEQRRDALKEQISELGNKAQELQGDDDIEAKMKSLLDSLEENSVASVEAEASVTSKKGNYWLQVATDDSLAAAQHTLVGLKARMDRLQPDRKSYYMILQRRQYYVVMVGGYSTVAGAKAAIANPISDELFPHGKFIRAFDSYCPGATSLDAEQIMNEQIFACEGVPSRLRE